MNGIGIIEGVVITSLVLCPFVIQIVCFLPYVAIKKMRLKESLSDKNLIYKFSIAI